MNEDERSASKDWSPPSRRQTSVLNLTMSAFGGKADVPDRPSDVC
jgi:hypothetical protein